LLNGGEFRACRHSLQTGTLIFLQNEMDRQLIISCLVISSL